MFWIVLIIFGIQAWQYFEDGNVTGGLICLAVIFIAYVMHLGAARDLKAWNNWQNYWAYGKTDWMKRRRSVRGGMATDAHEEEVINGMCPTCGVRMNVSERSYQTSDGQEVNMYRCPKCMRLYTR